MSPADTPANRPRPAGAPTVGQLMTGYVIAVTPDASMAQVHSALQNHRIHHVMVLDAGKLVGIISDRDVLRNLSPFIGKMAERPADLYTLERRAHQFMTRKVVTTVPGATVSEASGLMISNNISCLPVLAKDGSCVGVLTWRDVLRWLASVNLDDRPDDRQGELFRDAA